MVMSTKLNEMDCKVLALTFVTFKVMRTPIDNDAIVYMWQLGCKLVQPIVNSE